MGFYYYLFLIILLFGLLGDISRKSKMLGNNTVIYRISLLCISSVLIIIMAVRYEVGTDYLAYIDHASSMRTLPFGIAILEYELFFILFSNISYYLFDSMQFFYLIIAIVIIVPFSLSIKHYEESLFYVFLFFFVTTVFFISMNAMRQIAAFSICLYALKFLRERKDFFFVLIVFASLWHTSALVYLSLYFLDKVNLGRIYVLVLLSFVVFKSGLNLFMISFIESTGLPMKFYFLAQDGASSKMVIVISFIVFLLFHFFVRRKADNANLFYNISLINVGVAIFADGIPGAYRLVYIFYPFYCFIGPFMIQHTRFKQKIVMAIALISLFSVYFFRQQIIGNANEILPYKTIFM